MEELLNHVHCMDCIEFLKKLPDDSIDSCVTDPPYFLLDSSGKGFMGKEWDSLSEKEWKLRELAKIVADFFLLIAVESNMVEESTVQEDASTKHSVGILEDESDVNAPSVEKSLNEVHHQSKANINSVHGIVLTKAEVLGMFSELSQDPMTAIESLNENVLFAVPCLSMERLARSIAPDSVSRLPIEKICEGPTIHLTTTAEARINAAIAVMIGNRSENRSMREISGLVKSVENIVRGGRYRRIISKSGVKREITQWTTSLLSAIVVMPQFTLAEQAYKWHLQWTRQVFRVLKPGAHMLAFSGTRSYHHLARAIEDAGFEVRDQIHWLFGSGFPKGQNISKAIDKKQGTVRTVKAIPSKLVRAKVDTTIQSGRYADPTAPKYKEEEQPDRTFHVPTSEEAKQWTGWNTQLKPAHEPIVLARKPVSESSIVDNVLEHGTGGLNIDATRVSVSPEVDNIGKTTKREVRESETWRNGSGFKNPENPTAGVLPSGRYPANLILSHHEECELVQEGKTEPLSKERNEGQSTGKHGIYGDRDRAPIEVEFKETVLEVWKCVEDCPVRILNEQTANLKSGGSLTGEEPSGKTGTWGIYGPMDRRHEWNGYGDSAGAARFFYCAKPSKRERDAGLNGRNIHITVKPLEIVRWLVRLVTPRGGVVLDPFLGSGTTAIAAENEGCDWLGCDISEEYCEIARLRIEAIGGTQTVLDDFDGCDDEDAEDQGRLLPFLDEEVGA